VQSGKKQIPIEFKLVFSAHVQQNVTSLNMYWSQAHENQNLEKLAIDVKSFELGIEQNDVQMSKSNSQNVEPINAMIKSSSEVVDDGPRKDDLVFDVSKNLRKSLLVE
jgi:hypothetical protein